MVEREERMKKMNDLTLFENVILHCQMTHNLTGTREALVAAQKEGLVDFYNQLTSAGRNVSQLMLSNLEDYQTLFDVEIKKAPDFFHQQANAKHWYLPSNNRLFHFDYAKLAAAT
jgi:hypothetical protein